MSDSGQGIIPTGNKSLREMVLAERLEFYREASATQYSDIREHILKELELDAEHRRSEDALASAHRRKQEARLSPSVALAVCILAFLAAAGTVIYLHVVLKMPLEATPYGILFFAALVISAIALLLSKALRPTEFLAMLSHAKGYIGLGRRTHQADGDNEQSE